MAIYQGEPVLRFRMGKYRAMRTHGYRLEPAKEQRGTSLRDLVPAVCPLGHCGTVLALTTGQRFVFAILGLVAVVVFVVLPAAYGTRWDRRNADDRSSKRRLLKELGKHE